MKFIIVIGATLILAGCDLERYRYPCQNPDNWDTQQCKKPLCEVSQTCPEHIFKQQDDVIRASMEIVERRASTQSKGVSK